jgi:septal ring factor EnvC (AmiA/AmiB activator)
VWPVVAIFGLWVVWESKVNIVGINFLDLLKIIIWPLTIFVIAFYFRKVVTYLFFSMEEFNFFGAKGKLRSVHELIDTKANQLYKERIKRDKIDSERKEREARILEITDSKESVSKKNEELIQLANQQSEKITELEKMIDEERGTREASVKKARESMADYIFKNYDVREKTPINKSTLDSTGK